MFGLVCANLKELSKEEKVRYNAIYCGICRQIREHCSSSARLGLSYDMAFLALLLMSLYEPEEISGKRACKLHPFRPRPWVEQEAMFHSKGATGGEGSIDGRHGASGLGWAGLRLPSAQHQARDRCLRQKVGPRVAGSLAHSAPARCLQPAGLCPSTWTHWRIQPQRGAFSRPACDPKPE